MGYGAVLLGNSANYVYDPNSQEFVNAKFQRVGKIIHDFDPTLSLVWIPQANRKTEEEKAKPYALAHTPLGEEPYIIFHLDEEDLHEGLIATIFQARKNAENLTDILDAEEAARQAMHLREQMDLREQELDRARFLARTPLNTIRLGNGQVLR